MRTPLLLIAGGLVLCSTILIKGMTADTGTVAPASHVGARVEATAHDCGGEPCDAVLRGFLAFFDRQPVGRDGNGRACADCHMATDSFQLSPSSVEARFQSREQRRRRDPDADDPLFRAIDADDFRTHGEAATDFRNLRQNGLVRITFPLPSNIRLIDPATNAPSDETFVDVWRSVPSVNDVALTGPDAGNPWPRGPGATGGYQMDARLGTLQEQALGALANHAQIAAAPSRLLADLSSFQRLLFTNHRVRDLAAAVREGSVSLPDPDPRLNGLESRGKAVFERACTQCHGGAGQSTPQPPVVRFHDISTQCPRPVDIASPARFALEPCVPQLARNARTYQLTLPNGTTTRRVSSDPGRALLTGFVGGPPAQDDWNKFDMPGLRGIRHTAPYFHNNSAATLEAMVDHYIEFFKRVQANAPPGIVPPIATTDGVHFDRVPTADERASLLAYLRRL